MIYLLILVVITLLWFINRKTYLQDKLIVIHIYCRKSLAGIDGLLYAVDKLFMFNKHYALRSLILYLDAESVKNELDYLRCLKKRFKYLHICKKDMHPVLSNICMETDWVFVRKEDQTFYDIYQLIKEKLKGDPLRQKNSLC